MPENEKAPPEAIVIESLDTTKDGIKAYLEDAAESRKCPIQSAAAMRIAVVRFILDTCKITDPVMRKQAWRQFDATPGWFGCNNSAGRQALGIKSELTELVEEIDV